VDLAHRVVEPADGVVELAARRDADVQRVEHRFGCGSGEWDRAFASPDQRILDRVGERERALPAFGFGPLSCLQAEFLGGDRCFALGHGEPFVANLENDAHRCESTLPEAVGSEFPAAPTDCGRFALGGVSARLAPSLREPCEKIRRFSGSPTLPRFGVHGDEDLLALDPIGRIREVDVTAET
jgi:hypothetical protein